MSKRVRRVLFLTTATIMAVVMVFVITGCDIQKIAQDAINEHQEDIDKIKDNAKEIAENTKDTAEKVWDKTSTFVGEAWDKTKTGATNIWNITVDKTTNFYESSKTALIQTVNSLASIDYGDAIVTELAKLMYENQTTTKSSLAVSTKSFGEVNEINTSNDPLFYAYDTEAFVFNLITNMLPPQYTSFMAVVSLNGEVIPGICYTDYSESMENGDGKQYFNAGFLTFMGDSIIEESDFDKGLEITPIEGSNDEEVGYIYTIRPEPYMTHCVALGKYFVFGINKYNQIEYSCTDYVKGIIDESLGSLYSFDEDTIVFNNGIVSLFESSNFYVEKAKANKSVVDFKAEIYDELEKDKNKILSFSFEDTFKKAKETISNIAQKDYWEGKLNGLLSFSVSDITDMITNFSIEPPKTEADRNRWIVAGVCLIAMLGSTVAQFFIPSPYKEILEPLLGAIIGAAMETFIEIAVDGEEVEDIDYRKVILAAVSGAICSKLGILGDSFVGAITDSIFKLWDGASFAEIKSTFIQSFVTAMALAITFKAIGGICSAIKTGHQKKLAVKASKNLTNGKVKINGKAAKKAATDSTQTAATKKMSKRAANKAFKNTVDENTQRALFGDRNKNYRRLDLNGNDITKKQYLAKGENAYVVLKETADPELVSEWNRLGIKKVPVGPNGEIFWEKIGFEKTEIPFKLTSDRTTNFNNINDYFSINPKARPKELKDAIKKCGWDENAILDRKRMEKARKMALLTYDECADLNHIYVLPTKIHTVSKGGIGHIGGISLIKTAKMYDISDRKLYNYVRRYAY